MIRALTWNLFHGRDFPPDPALRTTRSRIFRITERNQTHAQVNRDLYEEFASVIDRIEWGVALFQECPPHWTAPLQADLGAEAFSIPTSRNSLPRVRRAIAALNPDLIGSNEGGSNLILSRLGPFSETHVLAVAPGPEPERRALGFARTGNVCIGNLHASTGASRRAIAEEEIRTAAASCVKWAAGEPLIFGGDLNVRPAQSPVFGELSDRFDLRGATADDSIDHLLTRNLETLERPQALDPEAREVPGPDKLRLRLSDHAPVRAVFELPEG